MGRPGGRKTHHFGRSDFASNFGALVGSTSRGSAAEAEPLELKLRALGIVPTIQHALLPLTRCGGFSSLKAAATAADPSRIAELEVYTKTETSGEPQY